MKKNLKFYKSNIIYNRKYLFKFCFFKPKVKIETWIFN